MEKFCGRSLHRRCFTCGFHSCYGQQDLDCNEGWIKIDVQFIEKNTVLFRIENSLLRERVIQRRYWHVSDVPLVVREWSPETALDPLDILAMPMWIDLKGVPNMLFSRKGLKCFPRATGKFVKLHPNTELFTRLDVARLLVEVNLQRPLVEKISFMDQEGQSVEIGVAYPWLPPRCIVCQGWGHKRSDCLASNITILSKGKETEPIATETAEVNLGGQNDLKKNAVSDLLRDLECLEPVPTVRDPNVECSVGEVSLEKMIVKDHMVEESAVVLPQQGKDWAIINGGSRQQFLNEGTSSDPSGRTDFQETATVVSPSRFSVLATLDEDIEDTEVEEGEVVPGVEKPEKADT